MTMYRASSATWKVEEREVVKVSGRTVHYLVNGRTYTEFLTTENHKYVYTRAMAYETLIEIARSKKQAADRIVADMELKIVHLCAEKAKIDADYAL